MKRTLSILALAVMTFHVGMAMASDCTIPLPQSEDPNEIQDVMDKTPGTYRSGRILGTSEEIKVGGEKVNMLVLKTAYGKAVFIERLEDAKIPDIASKFEDGEENIAINLACFKYFGIKPDSDSAEDINQSTLDIGVSYQGIKEYFLF